jgi:DNA-binding NtrC family response regulator
MPVSGSLTKAPSNLLPASWRAAIDEVLSQLGRTRPIVVIRGEGGTGKEWLARLIHADSPNSGGQFVKVNCATPSDRLAVELFGHERDGWPGGSRRRLGRLEFAHRGTLFLKELGELPPSLHPSLLQVFQDGEYTRPGGRERILVDLQVIAATRQPLKGASTGERPWETSTLLKIVDIEVPPLRERQEEIPALAAALLADFNATYGRSIELSAEWLTLFSQYQWPGNVRELAMVLKRLVVGEDPAAIRSELQSGLRFVTSPMVQTA